MLTRWWARQRYLPPKAGYEYPCTTHDPDDVLYRYCVNEWRNWGSICSIVIWFIAIPTLLLSGALEYLNVEWASTVTSVGAAFFGIGLLSLLGLVVWDNKYHIRSEALFPKANALIAEGVSPVDAVNQVISEDLATRRDWCIRPDRFSANNGNKTVLCVLIRMVNQPKQADSLSTVASELEQMPPIQRIARVAELSERGNPAALPYLK